MHDSNTDGVTEVPPSEWDALLREVEATKTLAEMSAVLQRKLDELRALGVAIPLEGKSNG